MMRNMPINLSKCLIHSSEQEKFFPTYVIEWKYRSEGRAYTYKYILIICTVKILFVNFSLC